MTEQQYIIACNRARIMDAMTIMNNVFQGAEYGVDSLLYVMINRSLDRLSETLAEKIKITEKEQAG